MSSKLNKINWVCYPNKNQDNFTNVEKKLENFTSVKQNDNTLKSYLNSNNLNFVDKINSSNLDENRLF